MDTDIFYFMFCRQQHTIKRFEISEAKINQNALWKKISLKGKIFSCVLLLLEFSFWIGHCIRDETSQFYQIRLLCHVGSKHARKEIENQISRHGLQNLLLCIFSSHFWCQQSAEYNSSGAPWVIFIAAFLRVIGTICEIVNMFARLGTCPVSA